MQHWTPPSFDATPVVEAVDVPVRPVTPEQTPVHVGGTVDTSVAPASPQALFLRGLQEGLEEGRRREASALALRQLERRCGLLDVPTSSRIEALSLPQLEELALDLLEFRGVGDLQTWLEQLEP